MIEYKRDKFFQAAIPVAVTFGRGSRRESVPLHKHDFLELVFVSSGSTIHTVQFSGGRSVTYSLVAGDIFTILPGESHAYSESNNVFYYNVLFDFHMIADEVKQFIDTPAYKALFTPGCVRNKIHLAFHERIALERRLRDITVELAERKIGYVQYVRSALAGALIKLLRHYALASDGEFDYSGVARCIGIMERSPEKEHPIEELAREASMSLSLFYVRFQQMTGMSPNEYLINLRLANACSKLLESSANIGEIALQCGFCDSNHFIKTFRKRHGVTPGNFRKQFQL